MRRTCCPLLFQVITFFLLTGCVEKPHVEIPSIISDGMVMQRNDTVAIWGKASSKGMFSIVTSWDKKKYKVKPDSSNKWIVYIKTGDAGQQTHSIKIFADSLITVKNILFGEVWLCSGQSNMEITPKGYSGEPVFEGNNMLANANNSNIRFFKVPQATYISPSTDCQAKWQESNSSSLAGFSAVGYNFGKIINDILDVPVGLIQATWGGTPVESWTSVDVLKMIDAEAYGKLDSLETIYKERGPWTPSVIFNGMINPLIPYGIKGILWYQGESNTFWNYNIYDKTFSSMISDWRNRWNSDSLSFFFVQIAPYDYFNDNKGMLSAIVREKQEMVDNNLHNTGMAVTMDLGREFSVHPPDKITVSERLAFIALSESYSFTEVAYKGPRFKLMEINEKNEAIISFENAEGGLFSPQNEIEGFEIAGKDRVFQPAKAQIIDYGKHLKVYNENVADPVAVRYCFKDWCVGKLYNTAGLPASSFRTDKWDIN